MGMEAVQAQRAEDLARHACDELAELEARVRELEVQPLLHPFGNAGVNLALLRVVHDLLSEISPEARILQLRNLCINNNGRWTIPDRPDPKRPVLYDVQLFGVSAMADDPTMIAHNWLRAAGRILDASATGEPT